MGKEEMGLGLADGNWDPEKKAGDLQVSTI
jgi:hypothetical protein